MSTSAGSGVGAAMAAMPGSRQAFAPPSPAPFAAATVETRFMRLHAEGRFDEMWDMLAEEARAAWGGREVFIREMPRLDQWMEILEMHVIDVKILPSWTDHWHQRSYSNVAELVMRYRVRQHWREWSFERQVHLVPAAEGWRTLCYPMRARTGVGR